MVKAWDLLAPRHLGRWRPEWPSPDFEAAALCEVTDGIGPPDTNPRHLVTWCFECLI